MRLRSDRPEHQTQIGRIQVRHEVRFDDPLKTGREATLGNRVADRRQIPKPVRPHRLPRRRRDEGLRRAPIRLPVGLILVADRMHQRKSRVPIVRAFRLRKPRKLRHERSVGVYTFQRHHQLHGERVGFLHQPRAPLGIVVGQLHPVARFHAQVLREPFVDHDLVVAHPGRRPRRPGRRHDRVRRQTIAGPDGVRQVGQHRNSVGHESRRLQVFIPVVCESVVLPHETGSRRQPGGTHR